MNRRRFGRVTTLGTLAALAPSRAMPGRAISAAPTAQPSTPVAEARCVPAVAVRVGLGQAHAIERAGGRGVTVRFVAVEDDSRCPVSQGVQCAWAGMATVVVAVERGGGADPEVVQVPMVAGDVFHHVWGHQGWRLFVVAAGLSGDSATPREDLVLDLVVLPDWPGAG